MKTAGLWLSAAVIFFSVAILLTALQAWPHQNDTCVASHRAFVKVWMRVCDQWAPL